jgi:RNA polymerase sigma-70 factor, ECF subfamily
VSSGSKPAPDDFDAILAAAQAGEAWAATVLFEDVHPRIVRYLRSREYRAAEDLAGEVWLGVAKGIHQFTGDAIGFRAWVFTIARRRLADYRREAVRRATDVVDDAFFADRASPDAPERETIDRLAGDEVAALVRSVLSDDQAEVVLLRVLGGLEAEEVAAIMSRSPNWVRVTQHRAVRHLAERLGSRIDVMR